MKMLVLTGFASALAISSTAPAKWTEKVRGAPVAVAKSGLMVSPPQGWNMASLRFGKKAETWSIDGPALNRLDFYGAILPGEALVREVSKKRDPLPKFAASMLPSDVAEYYERTNRLAFNVSDFSIDTVIPKTFAGQPGFRFTYHYTTADNLSVRGLASGAIVSGRLYLIAFAAPATHYYEADLESAQVVMDSAKLG